MSFCSPLPRPKTTWKPQPVRKPKPGPCLTSKTQPKPCK